MKNSRNRPPSFGAKIQPILVDNTDFLLERLSADCPPLQFLREFTQNAIEAIRENSDGTGSIFWDVDWIHHGHSGAMKLCIIDTGCGMKPEQMAHSFGNLMSTSKVQSNHGNFGVGAKISAVSRNPAGLIVMSWQNGIGYMVQMRYDPDAGVYGLRRWAENGGKPWIIVSDDRKPAEIDQHGTMVVFHGMNEADCTIEPAEGSVPMRSRWVLRNLNQRYFRFPAGVQIKAREGWRRHGNSKHCFLRRVEGQEAWLEANAQAKGKVRLNNATAHWWIIGAEVDRNAGSYAPCGQVAALYQNELYELRAGGAARSLLQTFGATFCFDRVVIYVEPDLCPGQDVSANTVRTALRINNEDIGWSDWAGQFRKVLPEAIAALQQEITARASKHDHTGVILERIAELGELYDMRTHLPSRNGTTLISSVPTSHDRGARSQQDPTTSDSSGDDGQLAGAAGAGDTLVDGAAFKDVQFTARHDGGNEGSRREHSPSKRRPAAAPSDASGSAGSGSSRASRTRRFSKVVSRHKHYVLGHDEPGVSVAGRQFIKVTWISERTGTRQRDDLVHRAARYLPEQSQLLVNADFPIFTHMEERWHKEYIEVPGSVDVVRQVVREWFETSLIEVAVSAHSLMDAGQWSTDELGRILTEEALTAAVMPRWLINKMIENTLAAQMPAMRSVAPDGPDL